MIKASTVAILNTMLTAKKDRLLAELRALALKRVN
jgi:hypothetical protein